MKKYEVTFASGGGLTVEACDQYAARTLAMVERYGIKPSAVVPHAPNYSGNGLTTSEAGS